MHADEGNGPQKGLAEALAEVKRLQEENERLKKLLGVRTSVSGIIPASNIPSPDALLAHDTGILSATTAFGKTVVAAWMIAARKVNTLVLVHRRQLLDQWRERLSVFLNLPVKLIGQFGGRLTNFRMPAQAQKAEIHEIYAALIHDKARNDMIFKDLLDAIKRGPSPLVLTERREHLKLLASRLENAVKNIIVLQGGMGVKQRKAVMSRLLNIPENEERVLVATGRYIGEGFDDARLDTLFLALPISWRGTVQQYVGRLHRLHDPKKEVVVYDYVDGCVPMLAAMFDKRQRGYESVGYCIAPDQLL